MQTYHGSCHCGRVTFEADADLSKLVRCTCSICRKKGGTYIRIPPDQFRLLSGADDLIAYQFNTKTASHPFCRHCGVHAFGHPRTDPSAYLLNVQCLDDYDIMTADPEIEWFDGRDWEAAFEVLNKSD